MWVGQLIFDEADVPTVFHARDPDIRKVVCVCAKTHVLVQIMGRDVVAPHHCHITLPIAHNKIGSAFDQNPKSMGIERKKGKEAMEQHQNHASAEGREKRRRAVNGSRKDCGKNDNEYGVERSFPRE